MDKVHLLTDRTQPTVKDNGTREGAIQARKAHVQSCLLDLCRLESVSEVTKWLGELRTGLNLRSDRDHSILTIEFEELEAGTMIQGRIDDAEMWLRKGVADIVILENSIALQRLENEGKEIDVFGLDKRLRRQLEVWFEHHYYDDIEDARRDEYED